MALPTLLPKSLTPSRSSRESSASGSSSAKKPIVKAVVVPRHVFDVEETAGIDWVRPGVLAKELGKQPPQIYSMMKKGRIGQKTVNGVRLASRSSALLAFQNPLRKGRTSNKTVDADGNVTYTNSPLKTGDIISWGGKNGRMIAQAKEKDELLTYFRNIKQKEMEFQNTSLVRLIKDGTMTLEDPLELLDMVAHAFKSRDQEAFSEAVAATVRSIREAAPAIQDALDDDEETRKRVGAIQ